MLLRAVPFLTSNSSTKQFYTRTVVLNQLESRDFIDVLDSDWI